MTKRRPKALNTPFDLLPGDLIMFPNAIHFLLLEGSPLIRQPASVGGWKTRKKLKLILLFGNDPRLGDAFQPKEPAQICVRGVWVWSTTKLVRDGVESYPFQEPEIRQGFKKP